MGGRHPPPAGIAHPAVTVKNKAGRWAPGKYQIDCVNICVCDARTPPAGNGHRQPEKHPAEASEKFSSVLCFTKGCLCLYFIQIHACVHTACVRIRSRKRARRKRFAIARLAIGNFYIPSHRESFTALRPLLPLAFLPFLNFACARVIFSYLSNAWTRWDFKKELISLKSPNARSEWNYKALCEIVHTEAEETVFPFCFVFYGLEGCSSDATRNQTRIKALPSRTRMCH